MSALSPRTWGPLASFRSALQCSGLLAVLLGSVWSCTEEPPPPPVDDRVLVISDPTTSSFTPEKLPGTRQALTCGGIIDLNKDGQPEIVAVGTQAVRIYQFTPTGLTQKDIATGWGEGQTWLGCEATDLDADGDIDIAIGHSFGGLILLNQGELQFKSVPLPDFPDANKAVTYAIGAIDTDGDALPELYVARNAWGTEEAFINDGCLCEPTGKIRCGLPGKNYEGTVNLLLHNLGGGEFEIAEASGAEDLGQSQGLGIYDIDGDGRQDIIVANDAGQNRVFRNKGDRTFEDISASLGLTQRNHGMGVVWGDLDGDRKDDLVISQIGFPLVLGRSGSGFTEWGTERGFKASAEWSWGMGMEDFDNDGDLDLLILNDAFPAENMALLCPDPSFINLSRSLIVFYRNDGTGHFTAETGVPRNHPVLSKSRYVSSGHALGVGDVNGDGVLDALISQRYDPDATDLWLLLGKLTTKDRNITIAAPQGAVVEACVGSKCTHREVGGSHSTQAIHEREVYFGIGQSPNATVTVEWPHGQKHELGQVKAGQRVVWLPPAN